MTRIEDMSEPERQSWITFLADGAVFIYFWQKMSVGWSLQPDHFGRGELAGVVMGIVVLTVILHTAISIVFELRARQEGASKDERDTTIARLGSRNAYWVMQAGVGVITVLLLSEYIIGEGFQYPFSVMTPVQMIFALMFISYVADLIRHGTILLAYRA